MKKHFIHIPKNGGMTIRHSPHLKNKITLSGPPSHKSREYTHQLHTTMEKDGEHHGNEHARWRDLYPKYQQNCFAIVRNPWSRVVSRYTFSQKTHQQGSKYSPESFTFEEFLEQRHIYGGREFYWHRAIKGWYNQKDYVTDEQGNLKVDILRLEKLKDDFNKYFKMNVQLNNRNISNDLYKKDYKEFYTPATKKIIEEWYGEDIEFFGFSFEGAATKNIYNK